MSKRPIVLIIDDNLDDVFLAKHFLKKSQAFGEICDRPDGEDAFKWFEHYDDTARDHAQCFPPDIVLLDINMPRMNGFEFLKALSELDCPKPFTVVMLTSSQDTQEIARAENYDIVKGFISKPLSEQDAAQLAARFSAEDPDE